MKAKKEGAQPGAPKSNPAERLTESHLAVQGGGLMLFSFQGTDVRMITVDGAPWWVGKDVCEALEYRNPSDAMSTHCKGVVKRYPLSTPGGIQELRIINEPDLFRLITHSRLPEAERFERKIFEEVLPCIRKHGVYVDTSRRRDSASTKGFFDILFPDERKIARKAASAVLKIVKAGELDSVDDLCRYYDGGLKYSEMAKLLGVSESTISRWISLCCDAGLLEHRRAVFS